MLMNEPWRPMTTADALPLASRYATCGQSGLILTTTRERNLYCDSGCAGALLSVRNWGDHRWRGGQNDPFARQHPNLLWPL